MSECIFDIIDLTVYYMSILGDYKSVDGVSFKVHKNEIFGIAGESGCGKSTLVEGILRLVKPPGYIKGGKVIFNGMDLLSLDEGSLRDLRWRKISYIPQGSMNSLNPVLRIEEQISEAITEHSDVAKKEAKIRARKLLESVNLSPDVVKMYPHELSGGMKQRVIIAMAQALEPDLIVADEPTTALDVTAQRIVLQSIKELRDKCNASVILIAHDMAVHAQMVDKLAIMYAGKIIEIGSVYDIFTQPLHPYTKGLIAAIPTLDKEIVKGIPGSAPSPLDWPSGCRFHPRCQLATVICKHEKPELSKVNHGRLVACHLYQK